MTTINDTNNNNNNASTGTSSSILQLDHADAEAALLRFQEFLRFETVSATGPDSGEYEKCAHWLVEQLKKSLSFLHDVHLLPEAPDHSPVVVAHWPGKNTALPIVLLNSHYDVVPVDVEKWTVPPFEGVRQRGKVYGRGTQDMKCVCIQYMEALRQLALTGWQPERSIYLTFVPDEETGGAGMAAVLDSHLYKNVWGGVNGIALALDEGLASTTDTFDVFYGERLPWWVQVEATGPTGHGSRFIDNTAVEQLLELSNKAMAFRQGQRDKLQLKHNENCSHATVARKAKTLGDVTSLNITTLQAGLAVGNTFAYNVVPSSAKLTLDIRISPHMPPTEMKGALDLWCRECSKAPEQGAAVTWDFLGGQGNHAMEHATTETDRTVNPWYAVFCDALHGMGCDIAPQVFPAATDSRFLRALGIRALGFSPMRNTEILLHEHDEYILESNFLEGIGVYVGLIRTLGSQGAEMDITTGKKRKAGPSEDGSEDEKKM